MNERLRSCIADAEGAGELEGASRGAAEHPVCGDVMQIDVRVADGQVADLAWKAQGCPATMAVASVLSRAWVGKPVGELENSLTQVLDSLGGLKPHERHAQKLALRAFDDAQPGVRR
ncbi:MAG: iron-sulfur cluster assembly scaffold protein [Planctomycetota bacterium]